MKFWTPKMTSFSSFLCALFLVCFLQPSSQGTFRFQLPSSVELTDEAFSNACLQQHNHYRYLHDTKPLITSQNLNDEAKSYATHLAQIGSLSYDSDLVGVYGINLAYFYQIQPLSENDAKEVVSSWYSEGESQYSYDDGRSTRQGTSALHFTQLLWAQSRELGCQYAKSSSGRVFIVALYSPKGNIQGQFTANVKPLNASKSAE